MRYAALALLIAVSAAAEPTAELVRLDRESQGHLTSESRARFRAELDKVKAAVPASSENAALEARILARLEDEEKPAQRLALGRTRYEEQNYPAALAEADAILRRDPMNKEALTLKHFSEGRAAMNAPAADRRSPPAASAFHFAADQAALPVKLRIKLPPATAPPAIVSRRATPPAAPGPLPLLPLAGAAALGLAAYEVSRSRAAYQSAEGLDDEHPKPVGPYQRLLAGAILAGAAGALIYTLGAVVVSAAPVALRIASSEAGAVNPALTETAEGAIPQTEVVAADTEQIVIKKGEILNRVWHSAWTKGSRLSGPNGYSYCRGACLPLHAARAVEGRGLDVSVINDARAGGLYAVTEDMTVFVRRSFGGYDEEILLRSPGDMRKLEFLRESVSQIPRGK